MAKREQRAKGESAGSELIEKVLFINRCSKTVKGGRKMSFSALIVVGDGKGSVGCGFAKAKELTEAIGKAGERARKSIKKIIMEGTTIPHDVLVKCDGAKVLMKPASEGTGIIAGSKVRAVLECAGVQDVMAKSLGSNNPVNLVLAAFKALHSLTSREELKQERRGIA